MRNLDRFNRESFTGGVVWGTVLCGVGLIILLDHMGIVNAGRLWNFWPLIIVVAGVVNVVQAGRRPWGAFLIFLGIILQLDQLGIAHFHWGDLWPIALIGAGLMMIWGTIEARKAGLPPDADTRNALNELAVFGSVERSLNTKQFRGGRIMAVFGGVELDLRQADMETDEIVLVINALFGGVEVRVPETWAVSSHGTGIFGGYVDGTRFTGVEDLTKPKAKVLLLQGMAVFGGVEIKN